MNKSVLVESFLSHLFHDDFLEDDAIQHFLKEYPSSFFQGEAYRVLIFKNKNDYINADITFKNDKSFTKSLDGIRYFLDVKTPVDLSDSSLFIILAKVKITGLDVAHLAEILKKESHFIPAYAFREQEIIALEVGSVHMLYSGPMKDFKIGWF